MATLGRFLVIGILLCFILTLIPDVSARKRPNEVDVPFYREKVKKMFYHAYEGYLKYAYPYDELQPLTCQGFDTWGSYSLTLIDALDTLAVIGNYSEFRRIANIVIDKGENIFDMDINVSVFETNIRIVGGLLSAHTLMKRTGMQLEPAWPCSGPLLRMAESIARRLLPAFDTPTGMPYGTVNLRSGVPKGETSITCTAGVGTFIVEFGTLSRLTGDPIFEKTAIRAIRSLWKFRSPLGLLGNHIDVKTGRWTALDSGIGGGVDSYFEYLVKGSILFNLPELLYLFRDYEEPIKKYLKRDDWYMWAHMNKGSITLPMFTSLDAFWPGIQVLLGDLDSATKTMHNFQQVWRQFGAVPEYYNIPKAEAHKGREGYPLRPELIESLMYLYRATKDPVFLEMGVDMVEAIERIAKTSCGYATIKDVRDHRLEDRMESFFLAETAKYLYLLFDPNNFIHNNGSHGTHINTPSGSCIIEAGGYVFNTEAHPIDLASVYCCSAEKQDEDRKLDMFHSNLDLLTLMGLVEDISELTDTDWSMRNRKKKNENEGISDHKNEDISEEENDEVSADAEFMIDGDIFKERFGAEPLHVGDSTNEDSTEEEISDDMQEMTENEGADPLISESLKIREKEIPMSEEEKINAAQNIDKLKTDEGNQNVNSGKPLQAIDLTGLSDVERDVAKIFLKQLNLDPEIADFSQTLGQKMVDEFKGTEFENVASFISKQLMQTNKVSDNACTNDGDGNAPCDEMNIQVSDSLEAGKEERKSDDTESAKSGDFSSGGETVMANLGNDLEEQNNVKIDKMNSDLETVQENPKTEESDLKNIEKQIVILLKKTLSEDSESKADEEKKDELDKHKPNFKDKQKADLEVALHKLKEHLEAQLIQQYQQNDLKVDANSQSKLSNLENKRVNILSLTKKFVQLFTKMLTGEEEDDSTKGTKPSLVGLYGSLANYPLQYFHEPHIMHCPAQPFHSRISVYGEMFEE